MTATLKSIAPTQDELVADLKAKLNFFVSLYYRWQDEKEYEDFADYKAAVLKHFPTLLTATKRPFAFTFATSTHKIKLVVNSKQVSLEVVK